MPNGSFMVSGVVKSNKQPLTTRSQTPRSMRRSHSINHCVVRHQVEIQRWPQLFERGPPSLRHQALIPKRMLDLPITSHGTDWNRPVPAQAGHRLALAGNRHGLAHQYQQKEHADGKRTESTLLKSMDPPSIHVTACRSASASSVFFPSSSFLIVGPSSPHIVSGSSFYQ